MRVCSIGNQSETPTSWPTSGSNEVISSSSVTGIVAPLFVRIFWRIGCNKKRVALFAEQVTGISQMRNARQNQFTPLSVIVLYSFEHCNDLWSALPGIV